MKVKTYILTHDFSTALAAHSEPPCLSLYQPTHAATGRIQKDDLSQRPADIGVPVSHDATGKLQLTDLGDPEVDDVLDDLGELVLSKGGKVVVVPSEQMPTKTGAAATCRF